MVKIYIKIVSFLTLTLFIGKDLYAQSHTKKENNMWLSSYSLNHIGKGIDFNTDPPQHADAFFSFFSSGTASVCDANGALLFYTDGNIIWGKDHVPLANGWDINNDGTLNHIYIFNRFGGTALSSTNVDGVTIVPVPGYSKRYYVFSVVTKWEMLTATFAMTMWEGKLRYSIVDMEKNDGRGEVLADKRGIVLADSMASGLHAVVGDKCNYWLIAFNVYTGTYSSYNIDMDSLTTQPVISNIGSMLPFASSEMDMSPDRRRIAHSFVDYVEVADFDPLTGKFSNLQVIDGMNIQDLAFSGNSKNLYVCSRASGAPLFQYDISTIPPWTPDTLTLNNQGEHWGPARLGPDNKIYLSTFYNGSLKGAIINQPDNKGIASQLETIPVNQLPVFESQYIYELPSEIPVLHYDSTSELFRIPLCFNEPFVELIPTQKNSSKFKWQSNIQDGNNFLELPEAENTSILKAYKPGIYTVQYYTADPCTHHQDTFIVENVVFSVDLDRDLNSCDGSPVVISPMVEGATYLWFDGSTENERSIDRTGDYWVRIEKDGCAVMDTFSVYITNAPQDLGNDTLICWEDMGTMRLRANVPDGAHVQWSNGSTQPEILVSDSGWISVVVTDRSCVFTDSIYIESLICDCPIFIPNVFSPNGDGVNDKFLPVMDNNCVIHKYTLKIYNRFGELVWTAYANDRGWDGMYQGKPCDVGTYMYNVEIEYGIKHQKLSQKGDFLLVR